MFSTRKNIKSQNLPPIGNVSRNVIPLGKNHPSASLDPFNNYLKAPDSTKMLCEHKSACDIESSLLISIFVASRPNLVPLGATPSFGTPHDVHAAPPEQKKTVPCHPRNNSSKIRTCGSGDFPFSVQSKNGVYPRVAV